VRPDDPDVVFGGSYMGKVTRWDARTRQTRDVSIWQNNWDGRAVADAPFRFAWTFPIVASPHTPGTAWVVPLVADMQRVPPDGRLRTHRTTDAGETWTEVGKGLPDGNWTAVVRDAFCADAHDPTGLYVGTRDGCVYASADEGDTFALVADHLPDVLVVRAAELP